MHARQRYDRRIVDRGSSLPLGPGAVIGGKYTVVAVQATDRAGILLKAMQNGSVLPVHVRVLAPDAKANPAFSERFLREAEVVSQVHAVHLAAVLGTGRTEDGDPFLVTELLEGEDLRDILARWGRFSPEQSVGYLLDACAGVSALHDARLTHKRLQPSCLLVMQAAGQTPVLKVTDLVACAPALPPTEEELAYRAPEQLGGRKTADARSDIWALGVLLFEFLTGRHPFVPDPATAGLGPGVRVRARELLPTLPAMVDSIIDRCLAPDPEERFVTIHELIAALSTLRLGSSAGAGAGRQRAPSVGEVGELASVIMPERRATLGRFQDSAPAGTPVPAPAPARAIGTPGAMRPMDGAMRDLQFAGGGGPVDLSSVAPRAAAPDPGTPAVRPPSASRPELRTPLGSRPDLGGMGEVASDVPAPVPSTPRSSPRIPSTPRSRSRALMIGGGGAAGLLLLGALLLFVVLPRMVASSLRDSASSAGITITYESVSFRPSGVLLTGVDATFSSLPGTTLHAAALRSSFSGADVVLSEVELVSQSAPDELVHFVRSADPLLPRALRADDVHAIYTYARGVTFEGSGASLARAADGAHALELKAPEVNIKTDVGTIGPFAVETGHDDTQLTVHFAPTAGGHPGANVDVTWTGAVTHVVAHAPRGVYAVPAKGLGINAEDELDVAADLDVTWNEYGDTKGAGKLSVFGVPLGRVAQELEWEFTLSGPSRAMEMANVRARIGPFSGRIHGKWALTDRREVVFSFSTQPVPCTDIARAKAQQGDVPALLASLAEFGGVAKVRGNASAAGAVTVSLDTPASLKTSLVENDTCGLSIFAR